MKLILGLAVPCLSEKSKKKFRDTSHVSWPEEYLYLVRGMINSYAGSFSFIGTFLFASNFDIEVSMLLSKIANM